MDPILPQIFCKEQPSLYLDKLSSSSSTEMMRFFIGLLMAGFMTVQACPYLRKLAAEEKSENAATAGRALAAEQGILSLSFLHSNTLDDRYSST